MAPSNGIFFCTVPHYAMRCFQFGLKFQEFCSDICLSALRDDRHTFDSARTYRHDEDEAAKMADAMGETCRTIAGLFTDHSQMYMVGHQRPAAPSCIRCYIFIFLLFLSYFACNSVITIFINLLLVLFF